MSKMIHQVMAKVPPAMHLAMSIRIRAKQGEPQVKGSYHFDKSCYSSVIESKGPINSFATPEGAPCTVYECARHLGLSISRTSVLFSQYNSDYKYIYANYGNARNSFDFKNDDGEPTTAADIAERYGVASSTISRAYKKANNDYIKANADLCERFKDRILDE
tara:strand:- start:960 stop:1445 length:486 start_codon:yes stop_codon:yes gene_type:complete